MSTTATWLGCTPNFHNYHAVHHEQRPCSIGPKRSGLRLSTQALSEIIGMDPRGAGPSVRLLRPSHTKGRKWTLLILEAIEVIAQSLCCYGVHVSALDLICSPKKTVHRLLDAIHGEGIPSHSVEPIATNEVLVECKGSERIPFAGVWKGQEGLQSWLNRLCNSIVAHRFHEQDLMAVDGEIAFLQTHVCLRSGSRVSTPLDLVLQMEFDRSLVRSLCVSADSTAIEEFFSHG